MAVTSPVGIKNRFIAGIIDNIIVAVVVSVIAVAVYGQLQKYGYYSFLSLGIYYQIILPIIWFGYTLGKRAMGIRIARLDGEKISIKTMLFRYIVGGFVYTALFGIPIIISILMVCFREDKRAIHDFIANTYVTYEKPDALKQDSQPNEQEELA